MRNIGREPGPQGRVFASSDVCRIAGISARQLQWWDERDVAPPHEKGRRRAYRAGDVLAITVIAELRRKGMSLQKIRRLALPVRQGISRRLEEVLSPEAVVHVLTDGKSVYVEDRPARIIELLKKSEAPMSLVSLREIVKRLASSRGSRDGKRRPLRPEEQLALF